jgi:hypothetical protein
MLLGKGADVNHHGRYATALQAASIGGHKEIVQMLLDKGAYVNLQGGDCGTRYGQHRQEAIKRSFRCCWTRAPSSSLTNLSLDSGYAKDKSREWE